jgi:CRP-like cAMP-binding protein
MANRRPLAPANRLLAALPAAEYDRLNRHLTTVAVRVRQVIREAGDVVKAVYFPNGGVSSNITTLPEGYGVETATVGDEGMLGVEAFLTPEAVAVGKTILQVGDTTFEAMTVGMFRREMAAAGPLRALVSRYTQVLLATSMQSTACNAHHDLAQRCARWLLMTHDRIRQPDFGLNHEFLAIMLGVRRPTVTFAAGALQEAGIIRYRHGRVTVIDRARLEEASCSCYSAVKEQFRQAGLAYS